MIHNTLKKLEKYKVILQFADGNPVIDITFPKKWKVKTDSGNQIIKTIKHPNKLGAYLFFTEEKNMGFDELLTQIETIINYNIDQEKKELLFKQKTRELVEFFTNNSLETLELLEFTTPEQPFFTQTEKVIDVIKNETLTEEKQEITPLEEKPKIVDIVQDMSDESNKDFVRNKPIRNVEKKHQKVVLEEFPVADTCNCGPDDVCPICAESKGF
jgi:hypothetical protein